MGTEGNQKTESNSGRSVARFIAPALGAGGRRFESCRPDKKVLKISETHAPIAQLDRAIAF